MWIIILKHRVLVFIGFIVMANILLAYTLLSRDDLATIRQKFSLLAPRILTEKPTDTIINFLPLRTKLRDYTKPFGGNFAFYFEYLPTGTSIGVNEKLNFSAASLIKVPGVMAYYRQIENNGFSVDNQVVKIEEKHIDKGFGTLWMRGVGTTISLNEAVRLALVESDNTASYVVADNVSQDNFNEVYEGLDIDLTKKDDRIDISAKSYTSILKALYFSAILSKDHSQEILTMLTQTRFDDKLVSGVPEEIMVAHKIGVYTKEEMFQDCGIVYVPNRPYALCMISRASEDITRDRMKEVSRMVYEYVSGINKKN
jgi:beta-lactamase class A